MGSYENLFSLNRPIAGIDFIETTNGSAELSQDGRFLVIHDFYEVVILDRRRDCGVRLRTHGGLFGVRIEDSQIMIHKSVSKTESGGDYSIRISEADACVIPTDWPGQVEILPDPRPREEASQGTV